MLVRSSSFFTFKLCKRRFYYQYVLGLVLKGGENIDLFFGKVLHEAIDIWHKTDNLDLAIAYLEGLTWPLDRKKTKFVALALLKDYVKKTKGMIIVRDSEESFTFSIGKHVWKGVVDSRCIKDSVLWFGENKTTNRFFVEVDPNDQFISYYIGGKQSYPEAKGIMINLFDPVKTSVERIYYQPDKDKCELWLKETEQELDYCELCAKNNIWPQNPTACYAFGRSHVCPYKPICQADALTAQTLIKIKYEINQEAKDLAW